MSSHVIEILPDTQQYKIGPNDDIKAKKVRPIIYCIKMIIMHYAGKEGQERREERQRKKGIYKYDHQTLYFCESLYGREERQRLCAPSTMKRNDPPQQGFLILSSKRKWLAGWEMYHPSYRF